jgi:hypothetical protein
MAGSWMRTGVHFREGDYGTMLAMIFSFSFFFTFIEKKPGK